MHRIITIGREFGSGGRELGRRLSEKLGYAYYDQEIIAEISKRTALSEEYVRQITESRPTVSFPIHIGRSFSPVPDPLVQQRISVYSEQTKLLHELADKSNCIIVGRCADDILEKAGMPCLSLFICAPLDWRVHHRMELEQLDERAAQTLVEKTDKQREKYYAHYTGRPWGLPENYDLCINSARLGIDRTAALLAEHCRQLFQVDHL